MNFQPPSGLQRIKAIGQTRTLPLMLQEALIADNDFEPMGVPESDDWLASRDELGQTFEDFLSSNPNKPDTIRDKIYLQPLDKFPKTGIDMKKQLKEYAEDYFCMKIRVLPTLSINKTSLTIRTNTSTGKPQILTSDILSLLKLHLPADAFCMLAITMDDLYPDPSWNFAFGQASLRERVGVYSFARYDPAFYGDNRGDDFEKILLKRSCRVLVHETAHMFGLQHCIYYKCIMNGSNNLRESDSRPLHLCPVCLRKLQYSIGFDIVKHYSNLFGFYLNAAFEDEAQWTARRLERIMDTEVLSQSFHSLLRVKFYPCPTERDLFNRFHQYMQSF